MGLCVGKPRRRITAVSNGGETRGRSSQPHANNRDRQRRALRTSRGNQAGGNLSGVSIDEPLSSRSSAIIANDAKELIRHTLSVIRQLLINEQEPPSSLVKLHTIAEKETGWQIVVMSLIEAIPEEDALGPAVITLFLDDSPLPSKESVTRLMTRLSLNSVESHRESAVWHRNTCIVVGNLAEKMAGVNSASIFTTTVLNYLLENLRGDKPRQQMLFSLLALEKFAHTSENRLTIFRAMEKIRPHPLEILERWLSEDNVLDPLSHQVAFCAQWSLDNVFVKDDRTYTCMITDVRGMNAMLNHADVSEYLKIGPDGLEARSDVSSFESVRCTYEVFSGVWYYEASLLTGGVMQIGFATKQSRFLNHEGYGIGDDDHSVAYDGCRQLVWTGARATKLLHAIWMPGDVVGCLLDVEDRSVRFSLNGELTPKISPSFLVEKHPETGIFAAASFMSFQHCRFNFGASSFRFPPKGTVFRSFNDAGTLTQDQKTILPRRRRVELLSEVSMMEDACTICCEREADTVTEPCKHGGLCYNCALQVELCPFCRTPVEERVKGASGIMVSSPQRRSHIAEV